MRVGASPVSSPTPPPYVIHRRLLPASAAAPEASSSSSSSPLLRTVYRVWDSEEARQKKGTSGVVCVDQYEGPGSEAEAREMLSSTMLNTLQVILPTDALSRPQPEPKLSSSVPGLSSTPPSPPGGVWFWEGYRAALRGHHVVYHLNGTGTVWSEDAIGLAEQCRTTLPSPPSPSELPASLRNRASFLSSCKMDVLAAVLTSVVTHLLQQPMLEAHQGPAALLLCPTRACCDECAVWLARWAGPYHLLIHNLWDPLPVPTQTLLLSGPVGGGSAAAAAAPGLKVGKVADVVIATPPLWERIRGEASTAGGARRRDAPVWWSAKEDLDGMLHVLERTSRAHSSTSTSTSFPYLAPTVPPSCRPYRSTWIAQLAVLDMETQVALGYDDLLCRQLSDPQLPEGCQRYAVVGGAGPLYNSSVLSSSFPFAADDASEPGQDHGGEATLSRVHHQSMQRVWEALLPPSIVFHGGYGVADVSLWSSSAAAASTSPLPFLPQPSPDGDLNEGMRDEGLLVTNAMTPASLLCEPQAAEELLEGIHQEVLQFWSAFHQHPASGDTTISNDGGHGCDVATARLPQAECLSLIPLLSHDEVTEAAAVISSSSSSSTSSALPSGLGVLLSCPPHLLSLHSRWQLLLTHMEDKLSGVSFDGHVLRASRVRVRVSEGESGDWGNEFQKKGDHRTCSGIEVRRLPCHPSLTNPVTAAVTSTPFPILAHMLKEGGTIVACMGRECSEAQAKEGGSALPTPFVVGHKRPRDAEGEAAVSVAGDASQQEVLVAPSMREAAYSAIAFRLSAFIQSVPPLHKAKEGTVHAQHQPVQLPYTGLAYHRWQKAPTPAAAAVAPPTPHSTEAEKEPWRGSLSHWMIPPRLLHHHAFSVVVIRSIAVGKKGLLAFVSGAAAVDEEDDCNGWREGQEGTVHSNNSSPAAAAGLSLALTLEESCSIGRVISFYLMNDERRGGGGQQVSTPPSTASARCEYYTSLFLEFDSMEAAAAAVRQFNQLFEALQAQQQQQQYDEAGEVVQQQDPSWLLSQPTALMFRNETYYQGVVEEERKARAARGEPVVLNPADQDEEEGTSTRAAGMLSLDDWLLDESDEEAQDEGTRIRSLLSDPRLDTLVSGR